MSQSRAEWIVLLAQSEPNALIDQVKIVNKFIRDGRSGDLSVLYEHLAIIKSIGEFLYGEPFTKRYLEVQGLKSQNERKEVT